MIILGVQGQYTRRRLAEIDLRISMQKNVEDRMSLTKGPVGEKPEEHQGPPSPNPLSPEESIHSTDVESLLASAMNPKTDAGEGVKILRQLATSEANSVMLAFLDKHLQGVPDVQREEVTAPSTCCDE